MKEAGQSRQDPRLPIEGTPQSNPGQGDLVIAVVVVGTPTTAYTTGPAVLRGIMNELLWPSPTDWSYHH